MRVLRIAIAGIALTFGAGPSAAVDFDDPAAAPPRFAVDTVSEEAVTVAGRGAESRCRGGRSAGRRPSW